MILLSIITLCALDSMTMMRKAGYSEKRPTTALLVIPSHAWLGITSKAVVGRFSEYPAFLIIVIESKAHNVMILSNIIIIYFLKWNSRFFISGQICKNIYCKILLTIIFINKWIREHEPVGILTVCFTFVDGNIFLYVLIERIY